MWKDLTLEQKAEIMKMSVANGVTDINDIQQLYDGSVGHRFDDAGRIRTITTSGNGYIPPIKQEAIIDAAFDYAIGNGKVPIDVVRKRLYNNLYPYSYTSPVTRVHNAVVNNKKEPRIVRNIPDRDDIFAEYLQIPENERHHLPGTMYVRDSEYTPTIGGTNNVKYKKLDLTDAQKEKIILATNSLNFGENRLSKIKHKFDEAKSKPREYTDTQAAAMILNSYFGEYTLGKGLDPQKGEYRSYYDLWDLSPVSTYGKDETRGIGKPVPFYDRIYLSDYYGVEPQLLLPYKGDYFGKWLPELVVTNKKALGGHLYKGGGNKQQLGIIDSILTKHGVNYTKTSGYRGPNSKVGKLGSKSAHARTLSDGSSAAIDIVPGPGSSWDKLYAQMSSPEVRADLAKYGLDVLDETSASTMRKTGATGKHFHVGKGIKGQQGKGQIFGGGTWGTLSRNTGGAYASSGNPTYTSIPSSSTQTSEPFGVKAPKDEVNPWVKFLAEMQQSNRPASPTQEEESTPALTAQSNLTDFSNLNTDPRVEEAIQQANSQPTLAYMPDITSDPLWNESYDLFEPNTLANGGNLLRRGGPYDIEARSDNTTSVVRPVIVRRNENTKARSPERQRIEQQKARARAERNQRIISTFAKTPTGRRAANRAYAIKSQKAKQEAAKEEAAAVVGSLLNPLMPHTYVDMAAAIKNGQVNNVTDALAAPYLSDSWSMRNPGKALVVDLAAPFAAAKGTQLVNRGTRGLRLARVMNKNLVDIPSDYTQLSPKNITGKVSNPTEVISNSNIQPISKANALSTSNTNWDWNRDIALFSGDRQYLQKLRDLHSYMATGIKPKRWYHGTQKQFYKKEFDPNIEASTWEGSGNSTFLSKDRPIAEYYAGEPNAAERAHMSQEDLEYALAHAGKVYEVYPNVHNTKTVDYKGASWKGTGTKISYTDNIFGDEHIIPPSTGLEYFPFGYYEGPKGTSWVTGEEGIPVPSLNNMIVHPKQLNYRTEFITPSSAQTASDILDAGYDAAILKNINEGVVKDINGIHVPTTDMAVRDPRLLKLADALTFDDKGNLIPLSARDNFIVKDFRWERGGVLRKR